MKLFNRRKNLGQTAVEGSEYPPEQPSPSRRRVDWRRTLPRLAALLVVLILLGLGVSWIAGANDNNSAPAKKKPTAVPQIGRAAPASQPAPATTPATQSTSSQPATGQPAAGGKLTNTGPGETAALFVIVTAAGTIGYQLKLRRDLS